MTTRIERISLPEISTVSGSGTQPTPSNSAISVVEGTGAAEILSHVDGEDTFTVLKEGIYDLIWKGTFNLTENATPQLQIQKTNNAVIGFTQSSYYRSSADDVSGQFAGVVVVDQDNLEVKINIRNELQFDNDGTLEGTFDIESSSHSLDFARRGATTSDDSTATSFNIQQYSSGTTYESGDVVSLTKSERNSITPVEGVLYLTKET